MLYIIMAHGDENDHWLIETELKPAQLEPVISTAIQEFLDRDDGQDWYQENGEFGWNNLADLPKDLFTKYQFRIIETAREREMDPDMWLSPANAAQLDAAAEAKGS